MTTLELEDLEKSVNPKNHQEEEEEKYALSNGGPIQAQKTFRTALPQILAVCAQNILMVGYGMTLGFPTIAIPALYPGGSDILTLTKEQVSWFSSINLICAPIGCMMSGALTARLGRKRMMMFVNLPITIAWILYHYSNSVAMLYWSLVLTGMAGGLMEASVLTYVAEISQPHLRGMLACASAVSVIVGVFIQFLMGGLLDWRTIAAVNVCVPVAAFLALCFIPESPHWLIGKDQLAKAERSLCWLRGWRQPSEVHVEFSSLVASLDVTTGPQRTAATWRNYAHRTFLKPYLVVTMTFLIGYFGGVIPLQTFAIPIFRALGTPIDEYVATIYMGIVQLIASLLCVVLVHWTGKRPLTFVSIIGNGICFFIVATYSYLSNQNSDKVEGYGWVPITFILMSAFLSHVSIRHLPWMLIGEVFPSRVRNVATGTAGSLGYIFAFLVNNAYLYMVDGFTLAGTFWFYATVSLLGAVYLYYFLPETEGRTLKEVEQHFDGKISLMTNVMCRKKYIEGIELDKERMG